MASVLEHTVLGATVSAADVEAACELGVEERVAAVCVSPSRVLLASTFLEGSGVEVVSVTGFPSGAHRVEVKVLEVRSALEDGADGVDVVVGLGNVFDGEWRRVGAELCALRDAAGGATLKVILETAALTGEQVVELCRVAVLEGADFVKTSTGFHSAGGATVEVVRLMVGAVGGVCGVKASGGIRTAEQALVMLGAGASRVGCSATSVILDGVS